MTYRPVTDSERLPLLPLDNTLITAINSFESQRDQLEHVGLTGLLNQFDSAKEQIQTYMDMPEAGDVLRQALAEAAENDEFFSPDTYEFQASVDAGRVAKKEHEEFLMLQDSNKLGIDNETRNDIVMLFDQADSVLRQRVHLAYNKADDANKKTYEKTAPSTYEPYVFEGFLEIESDAGTTPAMALKSSLPDLKNLIEKISQKEVPDKLQRLCEAIYTMAIADIPITYEQALAKVSKITLIAPKRGGVGEKGA